MLTVSKVTGVCVMVGAMASMLRFTILSRFTPTTIVTISRRAIRPMAETNKIFLIFFMMGEWVERFRFRGPRRAFANLFLGEQLPDATGKFRELVRLADETVGANEGVGKDMLIHR